MQGDRINDEEKYGDVAALEHNYVDQWLQEVFDL